MDINEKLFNFFKLCITEHKSMFSEFDATFNNNELKLLNNILKKCYNEQTIILQLDDKSRTKIAPELKNKPEILISNPNTETYPYKSLRYYFESIINLYEDKYSSTPIDDFLRRKLFSGIYNIEN